MDDITRMTEPTIDINDRIAADIDTALNDCLNAGRNEFQQAVNDAAQEVEHEVRNGRKAYERSLKSKETRRDTTYWQRRVRTKY